VSPSETAWIATITVRRPDPVSAKRIERALAPEAAREVPRSHARLRRPSEREIVLDVEANDTGALRAAVNAYLGWVRLALDAEEVARESTGAAARAA
jgi:tRNA threonylcarbamoyladenosine modification (KEOPS) complex  Pcc1 subunit